ncbi:MAG: DUF2070 family protein [Nitrososphaerales archaeon]
MQPDSTRNIARRYRHLFTLPSFGMAVVYSSLPVIILATLSRYVLHTQAPYFALYLVLAEAFLLIGIQLDATALRSRSKVATFRRLGAIAIIGNSTWLIVALVGLVVFYLTGSQERFLALVLLGAFFAVSFRALIFGAVFYGKPNRGIPLAFVQPALLLVPVTFGAGNIFDLVAIVGGLFALLSVGMYLYEINKIKISGEFKTLQLLQAFLNAWVVEDPTNIERLLDIVSREQNVHSDILTIDSSESMSIEIIVPGVHPGPFYPIGSSNLPADIFRMLRTPSLLPLTVHSISDHDLNLPSKSQVENYVSTFRKNKVIDRGGLMSAPLVRVKNKATVSGFALGLTALVFITQAPHGMEDFPVEVREAILEHSRKIGFAETLIIDAHNSEGEKPSRNEAADAVSASNDLLDELKRSEQHGFNVGFAHTSELNAKFPERDLGPAGTGLILFELNNGVRFSLAIVDANNAVQGFREKALDQVKELKILELCTSDTHVTAAKTTGAKGYLALGEQISPEKFASLLGALNREAEKRSASGSFTSAIVEGTVKTIGGKLLDDFSSLLDSTTKIARNGGIALGLIAIGIIVLVALL